MAFGWLKKAVRSAGKVTKKAVKVAVAPVKLAAKAGRTVSKTLGKVPVVGGGLKGVFDLTGNGLFQVAGQAASGQRVDKVAINALKAHVRSVKAVAPYAQTVISVVPAVGPGVNAAIGAGLALASGQPISAALAEGVKSSLPGGPLAKSVFNATQAVIQGKSATSIVLNSLPIDSQAKRGLGMAIDVTSRLAKGQRVDKALIAQADKALGMLPKDITKAFQVSAALAEARRLQQVAAKHISVPALSKLKAGGTAIIRSSPVLSSAGNILKSSASRAGFEVGTAVMATKMPQPFHVAAIRNRMQGAQRAGFDVAVAAHAGMVKPHTAKPPPYLQPSQRLGYYITQGVSSTTTAPAIVKVVTTNPATKAGANKALEHISEKQSIWERFKVWLIGT